ncbi:MAG: Ada metal-binding domain-containing protein, partial [Candidatus ainarchaeum sp.]|nr:Ada metal-binding domain-containing protein [Candidatus ainarchaeum sp.]
RRMKKILVGALLGCFILTFCGMGISGDTKFVASKNSNKYHYAWCRWAQKIKPSNLVEFSTPEEAIAAGNIPCKVCNPPTKSK